MFFQVQENTIYYSSGVCDGSPRFVGAVEEAFSHAGEKREVKVIVAVMTEAIFIFSEGDGH